MAHAARLGLRMQKELKLLLSDPPPGVSLPSLSDNSAESFSSLSSIDACIQGPEGTVYEKGVFRIKIQIPERYPFQPPAVTFVTPIYHPNIDTGGRICLDILNLPPKGAWQPSLNISTMLTSIGLLLSEPNPDDGLMCEVSREYKYSKQTFDQKARFWTERYAIPGASGATSSGGVFLNTTMMKAEQVETNTKNVVNEGEGGSQKRLCGINRKLSLESKAFLESNKENIAPPRRLSLSKSNHLYGSAKSLAVSVACKGDVQDSRKDEEKQALKQRCNQFQQVLEVPASVLIVSDSEDSEEECGRPSQSRLSLRRKRLS